MKQIVDLENKKILVTGASSGIGRETAILLSQLGARVFLVGRNEVELRKTLEEMNGDEKQVCPFDLSNINEIKDLVENVVKVDGKKLDGLVHCAGMTRITSLKMLDFENLETVMKVNFYSFVELVRQYSNKKMNNGGSVVTISSTAALTANQGQIAYGASKAALNTAVIAMSKELAKKQIRVNSIMPGFIRTKMSEDFFMKAGEAAGVRQLLGIGEPVDIANMVAYLLSDAAKFITGTNIRVDGGKY